MENFKRSSEVLKKFNVKSLLAMICISILLVILFVVCVIFALRNNNLKYNSVDEMKANLQGTWTICFKDGDSTGNKLIIDNNLGKMDIKNVGVKYSAEITWYPSKGIFEWSSDKINVINENMLESADWIYKRGIVPTTTYDFSSWEANKDKTESENTSALIVSNVKIEHNSNYTVCTGSVTNNGKSTYLFVEVKGAFKDKNGKVIDTENAYACGKEGLKTGESSTFRMSVPKNTDIKSCDVSILDYTIDN